MRCSSSICNPKATLYSIVSTCANSMTVDTSIALSLLISFSRACGTFNVLIIGEVKQTWEYSFDFLAIDKYIWFDLGN